MNRKLSSFVQSRYSHVGFCLIQVRMRCAAVYDTRSFFQVWWMIRGISHRCTAPAKINARSTSKVTEAALNISQRRRDKKRLCVKWASFAEESLFLMAAFLHVKLDTSLADWRQSEIDQNVSRLLRASTGTGTVYQLFSLNTYRYRIPIKFTGIILLVVYSY